MVVIVDDGVEVFILAAAGPVLIRKFLELLKKHLMPMVRVQKLPAILAALI